LPAVSSIKGTAAQVYNYNGVLNATPVTYTVAPGVIGSVNYTGGSATLTGKTDGFCVFATTNPEGKQENTTALVNTTAAQIVNVTANSSIDAGCTGVVPVGPVLPANASVVGNNVTWQVGNTSFTAETEAAPAPHHPAPAPKHPAPKPAPAHHPAPHHPAPAPKHPAPKPAPAHHPAPHHPAPAHHPAPHHPAPAPLPVYAWSYQSGVLVSKLVVPGETTEKDAPSLGCVGFSNSPDPLSIGTLKKSAPCTPVVKSTVPFKCDGDSLPASGFLVCTETTDPSTIVSFHASFIKANLLGKQGLFTTAVAGSDANLVESTIVKSA
jgi:hypothetical protein